MSHWTCARKRFYEICLAGLDVQITCNYMMDDLDEDDEIDKYIGDHLSSEENSATGASRQWFNCAKFKQMLRDPGANEMAHRILDYFEGRDIGVMDTYRESCIDDEDDDEFAKYYAEHRTDSDFVGYGWYLLKRKHNFDKLWPITNFWWRVAGESQHCENGKGRVRSREEFEAECVS